MGGVPIRNARRGDIPSLLLLWTAMMEENEKLDPRMAAHQRAKEHMTSQFAKWLQDAERVVVVAEEGGRVVVGYAAAGVARVSGWQAERVQGEITDCFVAPPRRRMGVARRLVGRMMDLLFEKGANGVRLQASVKNEGSIAFWNSLGWETNEEVWEKTVEVTEGGEQGAEEGGEQGE